MKSQMTMFLSSLAMSATALAGTRLQMVGEGSATAPAEFLKVQVSVSSICHASSLGARQAVEQLSQQVQAALSAHADTTVENQLQVHPGSNTRGERTEYRQGRTVVLCDERNGWGSGETLVFKLSRVRDMDRLQDTLLALNDALPLPAPDAVNQVISRVNLSAPQPGIFATTYDRLTDEALGKAHQNALRQARLFSEGQEPRLSRVEPTQNVSGAVSYDRTELGGNSEAAANLNVTVSIARQFTFLVGN